MKQLLTSILIISGILLTTGCSSAHSYNQTSVGQVEQVYRGTVTSVRQVDIKDSGAGTVLGAVAGGLVGNQFGPKGSGEKTAATVIGALGGAYAGNQVNQDSGQELVIDLDDGREIRTVHRVDKNTPYSFRAGDRVRVYYRGGRFSEIRLDNSGYSSTPSSPQPTTYAPQQYQSQPHQQSQPTNTGNDKIQRLKDLANLRDQGVLTEAEFQTEKQKILNGY